MGNTNMCKNESPEAMEVDQEVEQSEGAEKAIVVKDFTFRYNTLYNEVPPVLHSVNMQIERGSRCLLLGSNGAGKSTLLNIMGGKHIHPPGNVMVLEQPAFHNTHPGIVNITGNWTRTAHYEGHSVPYASDVTVQAMVDMFPETDPARVAKIV